MPTFWERPCVLAVIIPAPELRVKVPSLPSIILVPTSNIEPELTVKLIILKNPN